MLNKLLTLILLCLASWMHGSSQVGSKEHFDGNVRVVSGPPKDAWDKAAVIMNVVLASVGIAGISVAWRTLGKIERQTKATENAAEASSVAASAAFRSAQAYVSAERALLLFTVTKDESQGHFVVKVVNYGKVPARRIEIGIPIHKNARLQDLIAEHPFYEDGLSDFQEWLAPQESWPVANIFPQRTKLQRFYDKSNPAPIVDYITYGQVTYLDGISPELRHSRYCVALDTEDRYEPISVVGNDEYLECT